MKNEMNETEKKDGADIVNEVFSDVSQGKQTVVEVARSVINNKENLKFVIENREVQPEPPALPPRKESPRRAHIIHDAEGFAAYLEKYKTENTVVMVDVSEQRACAVIDDTATKGFEIITLQPVIHPLFVPWRNMMAIDKHIVLRAFAEILAENRRSIIKPDGRELVLMLSQVKASRKTTLQRGFGKHSVTGIVCEVDIVGDTKNEEIELPDSITIKAPLYLATEPTIIEIDITLDADDSNVYVKCSSADLVEKQVKAFETMLEKVRAIDGVVVTLGKPAYDEWDYLE